MGKYNWNRLWTARGTRKISNDEDYNFFDLAFSSQSSESTIYPLYSLLSFPCLVLLGEPRLGKSDELKKAFDLFQPENNDHKLLYPDGPIDSFREIFSSDIFTQWSQNDYNLHLFIDGLDEETIGFEEITRIITSRLKHGLTQESINRLHLRITCRTSVWPETLGQKLAEIWGNEKIGIFELIPLQREEILLAATQEGLNPEAFFEEVKRAGVEALAVTPLTLQSLLREFHQYGQLSASQIELYERYCKALCEEPNPTRQEVQRLRGNLSPDRRMEIASQIAAIMLLTKQNAIWRYTTILDEVPESAIPIDELYSGQTDINRGMIEETLGTALFASRGERRLGWAHQSYAEFLAARYIRQTLSMAQIKNLMLHPKDGKIKPELIEVAAWLVEMSNEALDMLLSSGEVLSLFKTSVVISSAEKRSKITSALLEKLDKGGVFDDGSNWGRRNRQYQRLHHPTLVTQLSLYLDNSSMSYDARLAAINIAEVCQLQELQDLLLKIALNRGENYYLRKTAAFAIGALGTPEAKSKLKPLIYGDPADNDDELKAAGLFALWPNHLTIDELFETLTPRKRNNLIGMYSLFIRRVSMEGQPVAELAKALKWVKQYTDLYVENFRHTDYSIQSLMDNIMLAAWEKLDDPEIFECFGLAAAARLFKRQAIIGERDYAGDSERVLQFKNEVINDNEKRHKILLSLLSIFLNKEHGDFWLIKNKTPVLIQDDLEWALNGFQTAQNAEDKQVFLSLLQMVFHSENLLHMDIMREAMHRDALLLQTFERFYLDSKLQDDTRLLKEAVKNDEFASNEEYEHIAEIIDPSPFERMISSLDKCEHEDPKLWWHVNFWMRIDSNGNANFEEIADLTRLPGWETADKDTRIRIIETGIRYLSEADPQTEEWFGQNTLHRPAFAGYHILYLLELIGDPLESIDPHLWKKWASIIVAYPTGIFPQEQERHQALFSKSYKHASGEMLSFLIRLLGLRNEEGKEIFPTNELLNKLQVCWDEAASEALYQKLGDVMLTPESRNEILKELLRHNYSPTIDYALSLVLPIPTDSAARENAKKIGIQIMINAQIIDWWPKFWQALQEDVEFGRMVVEGVANNLDHLPAVGAYLVESDLSDLYVWLANQYPRVQEQDFFEGPSPIQRWQRTLLNELISRGTQETAIGLQQIVNRFPDNYEAKLGLERVQKHLRRNWEPLTPAQILEMVSNQNARVVQSSAQLLSVVIESLERLQIELQAETPINILLWNIIENPYICRPKNENTLTDFVKYYLETDLVRRRLVINREVEIRRRQGEGGNPGERTDIYVAAPTQGDQTSDIPTLIIEVKGSWHREIKEAMQTQLVERYLTDNRYTYGLYLVSWFNCPQWEHDDNDSRHENSVTKRDTLETLRTVLDNQAHELSKGTLVIEEYVLDVSLR